MGDTLTRRELDGTTEKTLTDAVTPAAAGYIYVTVELREYESGKSVNVGVLPVVS